MMAVCPICGKLTVIHWPEHWVYKIGKIYYCSENCVQVQRTRDLNMLHDVIRKRKEAKEMEKLKKDGTPRMKPGPKMGEVLREAFEKQLDEEFSSPEEALAWVKKTAF